MSQVRVPADSGYVATPEEMAYEARAGENALFTASRVVIGAFGFAFAALAFAYFYLRSANSEGLWRPHGVTAPVGTGTAIMALAVASTGLLMFGLRQLRRNDVLTWDVAGWTAVGSGLLALGLQCWELTDLPFSPSTGGYTSVFIGWAVMNIMLLVSGVYWAETLLARHARLRSVIGQAQAAEHVPSGFEGSEQTLDQMTTVWRAQRSGTLFRVNVESCTYFWGFLALVSVFFWIFFYIAG
jgi:heme/copper-type cytochrome/quinol oxidase subunit 3